jgi:hypothetical protein
MRAVPFMLGKHLICALAGIVAGLLIAILIASEIDPEGSQSGAGETRATALQLVAGALPPSAESPSTRLRIDEAFNELAASWPLVPEKSGHDVWSSPL